MNFFLWLAVIFLAIGAAFDVWCFVVFGKSTNPDDWGGLVAVAVTTGLFGGLAALSAIAGVFAKFL